MRIYIKYYRLIWVMLGACLLLPSLAYGQPISGGPSELLWIDVTQMLANISKEIPIFIRFIVAFSYTMGVCLVAAGIIKLKSFGHNTVMMSTQANATIPMVYVFVGTMMVYFVTILNAGTMTVFASPTDSLIRYTSENEASPFTGVINVVVMIVQLVGYIAFLRGWFILMKMGSNNSPGTLGKGLVHLLGGVLAANIMTTWAVLTQTFGFLT
jgi:intracellular multiplication protein IcmC